MQRLLTKKKRVLKMKNNKSTRKEWKPWNPVTKKSTQVKQADGIKTKEVDNRVKKERTRRMNIMTKTEVSDKTINTNVILFTEYPVNVC